MLMILRDALLMFPDLTPAAFHPPCRLFSKMRGLSTAPASERSLAYFAVTHVQCFGGVVEHPCFSKLWSDMSLPAPGIIPDLHGGFTLSVNLHWFGFPARKHTWLYIVGCKPSDVPAYPLNFDAVDAFSRSQSELFNALFRKRSTVLVSSCFC